MAQLVERLALAQVVISQVVGFKPRVGLCAVGAEPASDPLPSLLSLHLPRSLSLSLSLKNK